MRIRSVLWPLLLLLLSLAGPAGADTFVVNTTDDTTDGTCNVAHCSLREALAAALSRPARRTSSTSTSPVPACGRSTSARTLPQINQSVTIDGYTQPGSSPNTNATGAINAVPLIELRGNGSVSGIQISLRRQRRPARPRHHRLQLRQRRLRHGSGSLTVRGSFIGTTANGLAANNTHRDRPEHVDRHDGRRRHEPGRPQRHLRQPARGLGRPVPVRRHQRAAAGQPDRPEQERHRRRAQRDRLRVVRMQRRQRHRPHRRHDAGGTQRHLGQHRDRRQHRQLRRGNRQHVDWQLRPGKLHRHRRDRGHADPQRTRGRGDQRAQHRRRRPQPGRGEPHRLQYRRRRRPERPGQRARRARQQHPLERRPRHRHRRQRRLGQRRERRRRQPTQLPCRDRDHAKRVDDHGAGHLRRPDDRHLPAAALYQHAP